MIKKIIALLVAVTLFSSFIPAFAVAVPELTYEVKDLDQIIKLGSTFEMAVALSEDIQDLFSFDLYIEFDNEFLKAVEDDDITNPSPTVIGYGGISIIDNENGKIRYSYCTQGKNLPDSRLALIKFKVLKEGETTLKFGDGTKLLTDATNSSPEIDFKPVDFSINIGEVPATPRVTTSISQDIIYRATDIKLKCDTEDAVIYYTLDGDTPTTASSKYNGGIRLPARSVTVCAIAVKYGVSSKVMEKNYKFVNYGGSSGGGGGGGTGLVLNPNLPATTPSTGTKPTSFSDIQSHWAESYITELIDQKIINGYEDNTIRPNGEITRAEATKIIVTAIGDSASDTISYSFADNGDIPEWASGYVQTAVDKGIMTGYEDNTFKPNQRVSRKELAVMTMKAFGFGEDKYKALDFADGNEIASWAYGYIAKAVSLSIITGYEDNTFKADNPVTRAEACAIISKCLKAK